MRLAMFLLAWACSALAAAAEPELAIAGRSATLEEVVSAPHAPAYRLLIRDRELERVANGHADDKLRALLERARREGAVLFACEKDLRAQDLRPADLPRGLLSVDASHVWESGPSSQADRLLRQICS